MRSRWLVVSRVRGLLAVAVAVLSFFAILALTQSANAVYNGVDGTSEGSWAVRIDVVTKKSTGTCSGAIVSRHYVLTAAHCLAGTSYRIFGFGSSGSFLFGATYAGETTTPSLGEVAAGPDLGLLKTTVDLATVVSRPLPAAPSQAVETAMSGKGVTLFGWGNTLQEPSKKTRIPTTVQKTRDGSYFLSGPACQVPSPAAGWVLPDHLCFSHATSGNVSVANHGDSGAPWVAWYGGYWVELAAHHGDEAGGSYVQAKEGTAVAHYRSWLLSSTGGEILAPPANTVVRDSSTGNAWLVKSDGFRYSIPTGGDYLCFTNPAPTGWGYSLYYNGSDRFRINTVPEQVGQTATCTPPSSPPPATWGVHIEDDILGGTWARTDPNNGTWYSATTRPPNGAYWYPNGLGVAVDCARAAASYVVHYLDGHNETWNTWFHVTDGKWYPSAATREVFINSFYGLRAC